MSTGEFWPGTRTVRSTGNAFTAYADGTPSCFLKDSRFRATGKTGKTASQTASDSVEAQRLATGRCPGSIPNLSAAGDASIDAWSQLGARKGRG